MPYCDCFRFEQTAILRGFQRVDLRVLCCHELSTLLQLDEPGRTTEPHAAKPLVDDSA